MVKHLCYTIPPSCRERLPGTVWVFRMQGPGCRSCRPFRRLRCETVSEVRADGGPCDRGEHGLKRCEIRYNIIDKMRRRQIRGLFFIVGRDRCGMMLRAHNTLRRSMPAPQIMLHAIRLRAGKHPPSFSGREPRAPEPAALPGGGFRRRQPLIWAIGGHCLSL